MALRLADDRRLRCRPVLLVLIGVAVRQRRGRGPVRRPIRLFSKTAGLYDDPEWQAYVDEIGQRLVAVRRTR